nr:hypothetical protein JVH1_2142 [Rhodococcus sp. JVH1]
MPPPVSQALTPNEGASEVLVVTVASSVTAREWLTSPWTR